MSPDQSRSPARRRPSVCRRDAALVPPQPLPDVIRPNRPADITFEFAALKFLQVRGLGEKEQFVDGADVDVLDAAEIYAHAEMTQEQQRLLAGDEPGAAENAEGARDFVAQGKRAIVH